MLTFCESFHYKLANSEEKNIFKCKSYNQMVNLQGNPPKLPEVYIITIKIMSEFLALLGYIMETKLKLATKKSNSEQEMTFAW